MATAITVRANQGEMLNYIVWKRQNRGTSRERPRPPEALFSPPAMQFPGPGEERSNSPGVIYPHYIGGFGRYYGKWCIREITDMQSLFFADGAPRKSRSSSCTTVEPPWSRLPR